MLFQEAWHFEHKYGKCLGCLNLLVRITKYVVSLQLQPPPIVEVRTAYCNDMYEWVVVVSLHYNRLLYISGVSLNER